VSDESVADAELLSAATGGNDGAFAILVRRHIRSATLLAAQLVGDRDDAEDVVQDAFTVVYEKGRAFDASRPFTPWLYAIVRRLAANRRTRDSRRARLLQRWSVDTYPQSILPLVDGEMDVAADAAAINRAMADLPPMQRACFELVALRQCAPSEVALMHDIAESTVRQHVFRARAKLRKLLDDA
jgi:RNA polymerase sigma-70 factor (ECF subfamily)